MLTNRAVAKKLLKLLRDVQRDPFDGIGKPEALKGDFSGFWSRRITDEHRLVYRVYETSDGVVRCQVAQCRWHYGK